MDTEAQSPHYTLEALQHGLTVSLIATNRSALTTCGVDEELRTVIQKNSSNDFDYLPVTDSTVSGKAPRPRLVGLIELLPFRDDGSIRGLVRDHMRPLSDENLIGADASILDFIRDADQQRCRLVVSGPDISGLVSLSDLQRLPVRAALFAIVTHLEITMANWIRRELDGSDAWIERLSPERQARVRVKVSEAKLGDAFVDMLLFTEFADKVTIIKKGSNFTWGKRDFKYDLNKIQSLRNSLAHASVYANTQTEAREVCKTVRLMDT